jgi:hypothetical protein
MEVVLTREILALYREVQAPEVTKIIRHIEGVELQTVHQQMTP